MGPSRILGPLCLLIGQMAAYPSQGDPWAALLPRGHPPVARAPPPPPPPPTMLKPYMPPGPGDARAPCPALNTLANHGYINHDGRNLERQDIIDAFQAQFGIEESAIDLALTNALVVCKYVTGADCGTTIKNLTLLAEPHAFEHDHSFSREDYMMSYLPENAAFSDNQNFNKSIFDTSLAVLQGSSHVNYVQMNEIRLQREALSLNTTRPGWFLESKAIQEFEAGFIFAVMGDFNLPDYGTTPQIRVDWWKYWFTNESFPYHLGWHPPATARGSSFILSASSAVLAASVTQTPSPLVAGAIGPNDAPGQLDEAGATTTYAIPTFVPYHAAGVGPNDKRDVATTTEATATMVPIRNPYVQTLAPSDIAAQQAYASSLVSAMSTAGA